LRAAAGNPEIAALAERFQQREEAAHLYVEAYRRYCWPVHSLADLKLAPFHVLASESGVQTAHDHVWHMETLARICDADPDLLLATPFRVVDLTDKADQEKGIQWWEELTASGGEGMVVKPLEFVTKGRKGLAQPAVKVRGREYLRIIYGPEYTLPEHLERLKSRVLAPSDRLLSANSPWDWNHWRDSYTRNPSAEFTSAFLVCWHWRANPLIPGCRIAPRMDQVPAFF
jgi:hypothetical protein